MTKTERLILESLHILLRELEHNTGSLTIRRDADEQANVVCAALSSDQAERRQRSAEHAEDSELKEAGK